MAPANKASMPLQGAAAKHLIHLDMLRGLAALAVVVGHLRGFLFVDYGSLASTGVAMKLFYALTSLGHQAVIAFFALSGFLVGGTALRKMMTGKWSWTQYLVARLSRLWTVVIPALILTLLLDMAGRSFGGGAGYSGEYYNLLSGGPSIDQPADNSLYALIANIAFLQTIAAPVFGTNGPFWSLANEFWYYIVFPLAAAAIFVSQSVVQRGILAIIALVLALMLPGHIMVLGLIWLAGAAAHYLANLPALKILFSNPLYALLSVSGVAGIIFYTRLNGALGATLSYDLLLGVAWALLLPGLAGLPPIGGIYARAATGISEISYTLYATHYPLLAFVWFSFLAPAQAPPGLRSIALALAMLAMVLVFATVIWWLFERQTFKIRQAVLKMIGAHN